MLTNLQTRLKKAGRLLPFALLPLLPLAAQAQAPANDNPTGATVLPLGTTCTPLSTTNTGATTTVVTGLGYTNPGCGIAASPKDVWYTFTTNASGQGSTAAIITVSGTVAGQVRVFRSTGGAAGPFTQIGCSAGTTNNTQAGPLELRGLTPGTTYYVFVSGYGSADTQGAFTICASQLTLANNDASVTALYTLGKVSATYGSPVAAKAVVTNQGINALTNLPVTLTVSGATTYTSTQTVASLASGASTTLTFSYPVTATTGTNTVTATVPADDLATNNSQSTTQTATANDMSYIAGTTFVGGAGVAAAGSIIVAGYTANGPAAITTVSPTFIGAGTTGSTYQIVIFGANAAGQPGTLLYTSPTRPRPTLAAGVSGADPVTIPSISVGTTYFVGVKTTGADNIGIAYQTEAPLRGNTFFYSVDNGATFVDINGSTLNSRLAIDVTLGAPASCGVATALTTTGITATAASVGFTAPSGATSYTVTYTPTGGTATTVTPAPTASPIALSGLTAGTTYTVSIITNCAAGQTSAAATTTFTTLAAALTNDDPSGAITLPLAATCTPTNGTNVSATTTTINGYTNPGCGIAANPKDVWFKFTTAASGVGSTSVNITVTGAPAGQVRVFSAASAAGPFTSVGCAAGTAINTVAAPLRVDGLTPNATYYVFVSGYGSNDTQGAFTICAIGLAPLATPPYVTLPYTEGFEATWADDALAIRDIPTANWRNTPATGNNSWRREDDGFTSLTGSSAGWSYPDNEQPTAAFPTPPYVTRSSVGSHSARFHSFGADDVTVTGKLDLYANLSGTGTKQLSFDFINPSGTDKLEVLVSTDGGLTFGATPVLTATTNTTFTNKTVTIASTSATTVIRFRATSDYGNDDMGIDNLRLAVVTATQNAALAANVTLYPNPAHQSFQLTVPTGLRAASATLSNALGQVVQSRQLNLSAAGGTADFNVSSLAPGIYTLTLKSGADLVVKRVVVE